MRRYSKYNARKVDYDGYVFDSVRECERYCDLKMQEARGEISNLRLQVPYELIPTQRDEAGRVIEKSCGYVADFVYLDTESGRTIVEDAKGFSTKDFKIKKKLMLFVHHIEVRCV